MQCKQCGANQVNEGKFCAYCGTIFPQEKESTSFASELSHEELFDLVTESSEYKNRNSAARKAKLPSVGYSWLFGVAFLVVWVGAAWFMAFMAFTEVGAMGFIPFGMGCLGVIFMIGILKKTADFHGTPIETQAAIIVSKRTHVSGGGKDRSVSTKYFITCEDRNEKRTEYLLLQPDGSMYGSLTEEDAGVLFTRGEYALGFDRITV